MPLKHDPYTDPKRLGIFKEIGRHQFQHVNAEEIVQRILKSREAFEERQRAKLMKSMTEAEYKRREEAGGAS
jgi:ethanolamine-phosphate cytidylyltransferase